MSLLPGMAPGARFGGTTRVSRQDRGRDSGCTSGDRHGAMRRRRCEWGQPHTLSWRAAWAADAEWMSGKSRNRLAPVLTEASSWMSVRRVEDITEVLWGTRVSPSTVSELNQKIYARIHAWRSRPLEQEHPYVYLDGVWLNREFGGEVKPVAVLVAIGVNADGFREIL